MRRKLSNCTKLKRNNKCAACRITNRTFHSEAGTYANSSIVNLIVQRDIKQKQKQP
jgi:hypothetical protein